LDDGETLFVRLMEMQHVRVREVTWGSILIIVAGCGGLRNVATGDAQPNSSCFGFADGSFGYHVKGRLVDAETGDHVCCTWMNLEAWVVGDDARGFPAQGRARTDNSGDLEAELITSKAWGTCLNLDGTFVPPPEPPPLKHIVIVIDDATDPVTISTMAQPQQRVAPAQRWLNLGNVRVAEHPRQSCDPSKGAYCPLSEDLLQP
jgi:hypothetical protein